MEQQVLINRKDLEALEAKVKDLKAKLAKKTIYVEYKRLSYRNYYFSWGEFKFQEELTENSLNKLLNIVKLHVQESQDIKESIMKDLSREQEAVENKELTVNRRVIEYNTAVKEYNKRWLVKKLDLI